MEVTDTPTPEVTEAPTETPVPTIAPNVQSTTYTSADKSIAINLPDATWANKTDETDMLSFESPEQGSILILHGQGEEDMSSAMLPDTQDLAVALEQASDLAEGTDFEIQDYNSKDVNGIGVYTYTTKMLNTEKSNGSLYVLHKVIANDTEYYSIEASVKKEDVLSEVKAAVDSFQILGDSSLKEAAPKQAAAQTKTDNAKASSDANAAAGTDSNAAGADASAAAADSSAADTTGSTDGSSDGSESYDDGSGDSGSTISNSAGFTDEQLSNTDETRTIYRNSDGHPLVITPDGNGSWVDFDGNTYNFTSDEDAYDENGTSYYWHGEGADVYYMPVPQ